MKSEVIKFTRGSIYIRNARALTSEDGTGRLETGINIRTNRHTGVMHFARRPAYL